MKLIIELPEGSKELIDENNWVVDSLFDKVVRLALQHGIPYEIRPQGEWIEKVERRGCFAGDKTVYSYTCPFCGVTEFKKYPFCHCGADMRGKEDE